MDILRGLYGCGVTTQPYQPSILHRPGRGGNTTKGWAAFLKPRLLTEACLEMVLRMLEHLGLRQTALKAFAWMRASGWAPATAGLEHAAAWTTELHVVLGRDQSMNRVLYSGPPSRHKPILRFGCTAAITSVLSVMSRVAGIGGFYSNVSSERG